MQGPAIDTAASQNGKNPKVRKSARASHGTPAPRNPRPRITPLKSTDPYCDASKNRGTSSPARVKKRADAAPLSSGQIVEQRLRSGLHVFVEVASHLENGITVWPPPGEPRLPPDFAAASADLAAAGDGHLLARTHGRYPGVGG